MRRYCSIIAMVCLLSPWTLATDSAARPSETGPHLRSGAVAGFLLTGHVMNGAGAGIAGATLGEKQTSTSTDGNGAFGMVLAPGNHNLQVQAQGYESLPLPVAITSDTELTIQLGTTSTVTVVANLDEPAASSRIYSSDELLPNAGRPGAPVSVQGFPSETASGGVKAPQYFAPGVAGDHGEPIAQFLEVDSFLFQNNLTANAHGNGYADPNVLIAPTIGDVLVDNAGYNARYGDHSIDLAVTYALRDRLPRFLSLTSDGRDGAVAAGWSPSSDAKKAWIAGEALFGNGYLKRPEERQQYKLAALRAWQLGRHQLTAYGLAYYG